MSNSLLNISMITRESLMELKSQLSFAANVNRQYDDKFANEGAKIGATLNIRKPVRYTTNSGASLVVQDETDQYSALVLDTQQHVAFQFTSKDLALSVEEFRNRYIKPAITALANKIDKDGTAKYTDIFQSVGTPGTAPTSLSTALQALQKLDEAGAPVDDMRSLVLPPSLQTDFVSSGLSLFNDQSELAKQYKRGRMGRAMGFNWAMDQNLPAHLTGPLGGTPLTDYASPAYVAGTATIKTKGWTSSAASRLKKGDVISIASVNAVNPQSKVSTGSLAQFVVQADFSSDGSGNGTITIDRGLYSTGQYQNVDALPADGAAITIFGSASAYNSKTSPVGMAFHRDAFVLGMADLPLPGGVDMAARASDPDAGLSVRIVRQYDINNDTFPCRVDVLYGWKTVYPELACRIQR